MDISVRAEPSFIRLIYSFAPEPRYHRSDVEQISTHALFNQVKQRACAAGWKDRRILYEYVLPHLADHLNAPQAESSDEVGHWWKYEGDVPSKWVLALAKDRCIEITLNSVELLYFRTGVGMLILEIDPVSESLDDWQGVLHHCRFYRLADGPKSTESMRGELTGTIEDSRDQNRSGIFARRSRCILPIGEFDQSISSTKLRNENHFGFGILVEELLTPLFEDRSWERSTIPGLLTPFSAFFLDWNDVDEDAQFEALYRWRRQLNPNAPVVATHHSDLNAALQVYGHDMWLAYSSEGGGFFGADMPQHGFFDHELPRHLRRPYAFGFLLALHERLALARFSERIGRVVASSRGEWSSTTPPRAQLAELQDDFLEFQTRCRFVQVLRTANHHENYRRWEEVLEVSAFATEVEDELRRLFERSQLADQIIDSRRLAQVSTRVNTAVLGFALPTVVLAILTLAWPSGTGFATAAVITLVSTIVGAFVGWLSARYAPVSGADQRSSRPTSDSSTRVLRE